MQENQVLQIQKLSNIVLQKINKNIQYLNISENENMNKKQTLNHTK